MPNVEGGSNYNGIWIPKSPTVEKFADHSENNKYIGTDYKITI